jgi:hypothetical protein
MPASSNSSHCLHRQQGHTDGPGVARYMALFAAYGNLQKADASSFYCSRNLPLVMLRGVETGCKGTETDCTVVPDE